MYKKTLLDNGIRVISEEIPYVRSVSVGIWIRAGSRFESRSNNGVSHFLEHMLFKGTKRRTARQIAEAIDNVGGQLNAFTTKDHTCYYARVLDGHIGLALDILGDMLLESLLAQSDIDKEKGVILEEIKMYEDSPDELVHDVFSSAIFGDESLGLGTLGTKESVGRLTRDSLVDFMKRHYAPPDIVVACAGNVDHAFLAERVGEITGGMNGRKIPVENPFVPVLQEVRARPKDTEQVNLCVGARGYPRNHPDRYALHVLEAILGGGMSSRLFQELREERGLVYSTYAYHSAYEDTGSFAIYAGMSPENLEAVIELILKEARRLVREPVRDDELMRGKEQLKGGTILSLESTSNRMSRIAKAELFGEPFRTLEEILALIDRVTREDIMRVAADVFGSGGFAFAAVGPEDACLSLEALVRDLQGNGI